MPIAHNGLLLVLAAFLDIAGLFRAPFFHLARGLTSICCPCRFVLISSVVSAPSLSYSVLLTLLRGKCAAYFPSPLVVLPSCCDGSILVVRVGLLSGPFLAVSWLSCSDEFDRLFCWLFRLFLRLNCNIFASPFLFPLIISF